jgi:hypothetical protein
MLSSMVVVVEKLTGAVSTDKRFFASPWTIREPLAAHRSRCGLGHPRWSVVRWIGDGY